MFPTHYEDVMERIDNGLRDYIPMIGNVENITESWSNFENPSVVVGHDCRFAGELFAETVAKVLLQHGIPVHLAKGFVSTPMISLGAKNYGASLGIIITASHNPPSYNGYKLKGFYGGPLLPDKIEEIELLINYVGSDAQKLKSISGWSLGAGNNQSGFNGLSAGYRATNGSYYGEGQLGVFWSKSEVYSYDARILELNTNNYPQTFREDKRNGYSVRCVKD